MEITNFKTILYEYPLERSIGDVHIPQGLSHGADLALFIETDAEGVNGVSIGLSGCKDLIETHAEMLIGRDPRSIRSHWNRMVDKSFKLGPSRAARGAISTIDCALWDARAKANGVPLYKELGADVATVPAYASGLDTPLSDDDLMDFYEGMADRGVEAGKLKVGRDPNADIRRLELMKEALKSSKRRPKVMIDANEFWSPKQAIQRIHAIEERMSLTWVEEPVSRSDYTGLRQVSEAIRAPVATGENLNISTEYVELFKQHAVDTVQIGMLTCGITGALQVANLAKSFNRPVTMSGCPGRHMAHLAAALPHHTMMEVSDFGREAVLEEHPEIVDGKITLDARPGTGIRFDEDKLSKFETDTISVPTLGSEYRRAPDAGSVGYSKPFFGGN